MSNSAFPIPFLVQDRDGSYSLESDGGLTKRELFTLHIAAAMIGTSNGNCMGGLEGYESIMAKHACTIAAALLAELEKQNA